MYTTPSEATPKMDHYKKVGSRLIERALLHNEIRVTTTTKTNETSHQIISMLNSGNKDGVMVSACGSHVTKAVGIIEHVKKQNSNIYTSEPELFYISIEDEWHPDLPGLDILKVIRKIPSFKIILKQKQVIATAAVDNTTPSNRKKKSK